MRGREEEDEQNEQDEEHKRWKHGVGSRRVMPAKVYETEHLMRLIHMLPCRMEGAGVPKKMMQTIANKLNDLSKYIQSNGQVLLCVDYELASQEYIDKYAHDM